MMGREWISPETKIKKIRIRPSLFQPSPDPTHFRIRPSRDPHLYVLPHLNPSPPPPIWIFLFTYYTVLFLFISHPSFPFPDLSAFPLHYLPPVSSRIPFSALFIQHICFFELFPFFVSLSSFSIFYAISFSASTYPTSVLFRFYFYWKNNRVKDKDSAKSFMPFHHMQRFLA